MAGRSAVVSREGLRRVARPVTRKYCGQAVIFAYDALRSRLSLACNAET